MTGCVGIYLLYDTGSTAGGQADLFVNICLACLILNIRREIEEVKYEKSF